MAIQCDPCVCPEQHFRNDLSWRKAVLTVLCNLIDAVQGGSIPPAAQAVFPALVATAAGSVGAAYAVVTDLADHTKSVNIANRTDGDVVVSMDGGATDTYYLVATESVFIPLADFNLETTAAIALKQGTDAPTSGSVYIYSIR